MKLIFPAIAVLVLGACTSVQVKPVDSHAAMDHVCIRNNPAVKVDDFVLVMQDGFQRTGSLPRSF